MTTLEAAETLEAMAVQHGQHVPLTVEIWEPTGDGQNLELVYREITSITSTIAPGGRRVIAINVED